MSLLEEYRKQSLWRNWDSYIEKLPIGPDETVLDLGCSIGTMSKLLAKKVSHVIGIDKNPELLKEANNSNSAENITYLNGDLESLKELNPPLADGIWTSFVVAYFPDFEPLLRNWIKLLKPNGWIAIVEMSDLFGHFPLSRDTQSAFENFYKIQCRKNGYDFKMGDKLRGVIRSCGLSIVLEESIMDRELTFKGPAEPQILKAWEKRFDRMLVFKEYLGEDKFSKIQKEFLDCLSNEKHKSGTIVKFIVARK